MRSMLSGRIPRASRRGVGSATMNPAVALACGTLLLAAPMLPAQQPAGRARVDIAGRDPSAERCRDARSQFCCVDRLADRCVATGRNWRAILQRGRWQFLPAVGKAAPAALPLQFAVGSVRRGAHVLFDDATEAPAPQVQGRDITMARPGIVEHYQARPEGLEQSFVLTEPPAGSGDLVVRLLIETAMQRRVAADGSLQWRQPGVGGVDLGRVHCIDAAGWRVDGELRCNGDAVEMVVPAHWLEQGRYPLRIDPLFGTAIESLRNADCDFPDAAYDAYTDAYCVVWTMYFGGGQSGVVGSAFTRSGLNQAYAFQITQTGSQDSIRVTHIGGSGIFVLVWCNVANGQVEISGLGLDPGQAAATNVFNIAGPGNVDTPAVSGEATPFGGNCLVIWDDATYGIVGSTVAVDVNLQVGLGPFVQIGGGSTATEPAISKQGGNPGLHVVSWVDRPPGLQGWVRAQVVDYDLNLLGAGVWVQNSAQNAGRPAVDGDGFRFLFAWEEQEVANPAAIDIKGRSITVGGAGITSLSPILDLAVYPSFVDGSPDVAMLGDKFGVVYQSATLAAPFTDDVFFRAFARNGTPIGDEMFVDLTGGGSYVYEHAPRLIGVRDGDYAAVADDGLLVFADQDNVGGDSNVGLQAVGAMGPGGQITDLGGGCGPGGLNVLSGPFALGNDRLQIELYGAAALAIPFLDIGIAAAPLACGVCTLTDPLSLRFVPNTAGTAVQVLPLPGNAALLGITVEFQWLTFNVAYVGCPLAPGMASSNRVQAQLGY